MVEEADSIYPLFLSILRDRSEDEDGIRSGWCDRDFQRYGWSADGDYHHVPL